MVDVEALSVKVEKHDDDLYRQDSEDPGLSLRLDRMERMLAMAIKFGAGLGGLAVLWKIFDVFGDLIAKKAVGP